ncbi:MAG: hypothetical protein WCV68_00075 [Candidatus Paceibacterota bacterium]|jgi:hypothetical protein
MERPLVEESYHLSTSALKHSLARCGSSNGAIIDDQLILTTEHKQLTVNYWLENEARSLAINLCVPGNEPQRVELIPFELSFGTRYFFECPICFRQVSKLYLPPDQQDFKCRLCHRLVYELTTINKNSTFGQQLYRNACFLRFMNAPDRAIRVFYGPNYTKNYLRRMRFYRKLGLEEPGVEKVKENLALIRRQEVHH